MTVFILALQTYIDRVHMKNQANKLRILTIRLYCWCFTNNLLIDQHQQILPTYNQNQIRISIKQHHMSYRFTFITF